MNKTPPVTPPKKNKTLSWRHIVLLGCLGDESSWAMKSVTEYQESPEARLLHEEQDELVRRVIGRLPNGKQDLVHWKFGFYSHALTNKAIGKLKGRSKEAIRQRLKVLLRTLRKYAQEEGLLD